MLFRRQGEEARCALHAASAAAGALSPLHLQSTPQAAAILFRRCCRPAPFRAPCPTRQACEECSQYSVLTDGACVACKGRGKFGAYCSVSAILRSGGAAAEGCKASGCRMFLPGRSPVVQDGRGGRREPGAAGQPTWPCPPRLEVTCRSATLPAGLSTVLNAETSMGNRPRVECTRQPMGSASCGESSMRACGRRQPPFCARSNPAQLSGAAPWTSVPPART